MAEQSGRRGSKRKSRPVAKSSKKVARPYPSERTDHARDAVRRQHQAERYGLIVRVLELIQGHQRWGKKDLARELNCQGRTIDRYLAVLKAAGINWRYDTIEKCYRLPQRVGFAPLQLTDDELLGQAVSTSIASAPGLKLGKGAAPTTRKLAVKLDERQKAILRDAGSLVTVLSLQLADHGRAIDIIRTVQWALLKRQQVIGEYQSPYQDKPVRLRLHAYRLALVKQAWYLIACPLDQQDPKTYRMARFQTLQMDDAPATVPDDFDLDHYFGDAWAVYRGQTSYDVEIAFTKDATPLVTETVWHHTQQVERRKDGTAVLRFHVAGLDEIVHWVLGWSGRAKVIQPLELRELLLRHLRDAVALNEC